MNGRPAAVGPLVDHLFRRSAGRLVSSLARVFGAHRLDLAEEVVQEAMVEALRRWPFAGIPADPVAWLWRVARNRALDRVRREATLRGREDALVAAFARQAPEGGAGQDAGPWGDDELAMLFAACHPALPREARVALTLKTVGGLGVREIARAFLAREATVAQRLVRAKRRLAQGGLRLEVPAGEEAEERLDSVLEVLYLLFNEGHLASEGDALLRADLCAEAIRLGELVASRPVGRQPRVHALLALLWLGWARLPARTCPGGEPVPLAEQDRSRWRPAGIARGLAHLERAAAGGVEGRYHLEAAIAAAHVTAASWEATDWGWIVTLYDRLQAVEPSPVVALNRAVAVAEARGPGEALVELRRLAGDPALDRYHLFHAVEADLLARLGRAEEATAALDRALACPCTRPERELLERRRRGGIIGGSPRRRRPGAGSPH